MKKNVCLLLAILALAFVACDGDDEFTEKEAGQALLAAMNATAEVDGFLGGMTGNKVDTTVPCSDGGSIRVQGSADESGSFALDLELDACVASDITIDGSLDYRVAITPDNSEVTLQGEPSFSGAIEGDCSLDVTITGTLAGIRVMGTACGHDVDFKLLPGE